MLSRLELHEQRALDELGMQTRFIEGARNRATQELDFRKGRNTAGEVIDRRLVVTWKKPGDSWHNLEYPDTRKPCALAYHLVPILPSGQIPGFGSCPLTPANLCLYRALAIIGQEIGLRSGANWDQDKNIMEPGEDDLAHNEFTGATLAQVVAVLKAQGDIHVLVGGGAG